MKREITQITNFATFTSRGGDDSLVKVIRNDAGEEVGFELSGTLTTFDVRNENGGVFRSGSYDKFVDDYFVKHSLNVPLCLLHDDTDIRNLCGVVKSMTKTDNGVEMVAFVPRSAYYYNLIKAYVENGILQGFSNAGGVISGRYDDEADTYEISEFALQHVALVAEPADTTATFKVANTTFNGFETNKEEEQQEETHEGWEW